MCGIAGILSYRNSAPPVDQEELVTIRDHMALRGPDGAGLWISADKRVGFAHRRLAIIDLSNGGDQPMHTPDRRLSIVFNGEIYNYLAIRKQLEAKGHVFRSSSDTEVLLYAYLEYGEAMVGHLRGMYAFAIWRESDRSLFLARDPFGIKPLYYSDNGYSFRFASQVKALLTSKAISTEPDPAGHVGFFLWGSVPEPHTLYESIKCLPAGTTLTIKQDKSAQVNRFFDLPDEFNAFSDAPINRHPDLQHEIYELMRDSVQHHLVADVPVGIFLSSGIDSATITALASEICKDTLNAVTLGFEEYRNSALDETQLAAKLANAYGVQQNTAWMNKDHFAANVQRIFDAMDQPTIDGVNTYLVSQVAAQAGMKVALSGLGGDELFGSYPSFKDVPYSVSRLSGISRIPGLGRGFRAVTSPLLHKFTSPKYAGLLEYGGSYEGAYLLRRGLYMPWELLDVLEPEMVKEGWARLQPIAQLTQSIPRRGTPFSKVAALELSWYMRNQLLRDSDWAGMAHSLEIRLPMVDIDLFRKLGPFAAGSLPPGKADLANACLGKSANALIERKKSGFSVPVDRWIQELALTSGTDRGLRDWAKTVYSKHYLRSPIYAKERVLVFRVGNLGDTLVSLPAIARIREKHPNASLCLLTNHESNASRLISTWSVVKPLGYFDCLIEYKKSKGLISQAVQLLCLSMTLRKFSPQMVYNLAPKRNTWQHRRDSFFFQKVLSIPHFTKNSNFDIPAKDFDGKLQKLEPEWKRLYRIVDEKSLASFKLSVPSAERMRAVEILSSVTNSTDGHLIAIGPGSKMPSKIWLFENFEKLGTDLLATRSDITLVVLGGSEDKSIGDRLRKSWGSRATNLAGELSIYESAAVLEKCDLYIGNDTGTMHLAAMVGTSCVALFSARDYPGLWEPYGENHVVLRKEVQCAGCMLEVCTEKKNMCLAMISVPEAKQAILQMPSLQPGLSKYARLNIAETSLSQS